jgi:urea transporter
LTAVSVFVICGGKLRLSILGALLATILMPAIANFGAPIVSAPFVVTTWLMLALGWVEDNWFSPPPVPTLKAASPERTDDCAQYPRKFQEIDSCW